MQLGYTWNSAPIDGIYILRSIPAIGRKLYFPLNININVAPTLIQNNAQAVLDYLKITDFNRHFSSSILKILIEDLRTLHAERINIYYNLVVVQAGDIVMAIQSNLSKHKVVKVSYSARDPYQIIRHTGFVSYYVQKLQKPDSPELKFMAYALYPLPPSLKPYDPIDTTDTRYLNHTHLPLANPLKKALHIELYNEKWFTKPIPTSAPPITYNHDTLKLSKDTSFTFPSVSNLHKETHTCPPKPLLETEDYSFPPPPLSPSPLLPLYYIIH